MVNTIIPQSEIDILYAASNKLTQASTPLEQLEAVSDYARMLGASAGTLLYIDNDAQDEPEWLEVVAEWVSGEGVAIGLDKGFYMPSFAFNQVWLSAPQRPTLIEDVAASDLVDAASRANYARFNIRALAILPLNIKGRWVGLLMFAWSQPHRFDEGDTRIYTALIQLAGPVIDSMRLFEQTQKRAAELEKAKQEVEILYAASNRLAKALTPAEWLEAVSDYARERGAHTGILLYTEDHEGKLACREVEALTVAAIWSREATLNAGVGTRFPIPDYTDFSNRWLAQPDQPTLMPDVLAGDFSDPTALDVYRQYNMRGCAVLPLNSLGRWIGVLMFTWREPFEFEARDRRIYTALLQQATPAIDSVQLFAATSERAARAELLLEVNAALSGATTEEQVVEAVALYARRYQPRSITLSYLDCDSSGRPEWVQTIAVWRDGQMRARTAEQERRRRLPDCPGLNGWMDNPRRLFQVEDSETASFLAEEERAWMREAGRRAMITIPLHSGVRWEGVLTLEWPEPHRFSAEEIYIYSSLIQRLSAIVTSRRAYLAEEEARRESQLLYHAGEAINAATSLAEIVQAITQLSDGSLAVTLSLWENYNADTATYFEIAATAGNDLEPVGTRYPVEQFPAAKAMPRKGLVVFEDIASDGRMDPITRANSLRVGTRSRISVPLTLNNRWLGNLSFHSPEPRVFTPVEKRTVAGIGDLVTAAVERLRLREETERARDRAEILATINGALSQANDEQAILAAVDPLAARFRADFTYLAYVLATDARKQPTDVEIVAVRSGDGRPLPPTVFPETVHRVDDYPFLHLVYSQANTVFFLENLDTDPREEAGQMRALTRTASWAATIAIPLKTGDQWQGAITFLWLKPQTFAPEARALFAAIRPTATSVVNSRLAYLAEQTARRETEARARELETVAKVSAAATTRLNVVELVQTFSDLTKASFHLHDVAVYLAEESGAALKLATGEHSASRSSRAAQEAIPLDTECLVTRAARERTGLIARGPAATGPQAGPSCSEMAIPMTLGDRLVGVLHVTADEPDRFTEADLQVMGTLTDLVAVAVENARLYEQAQELAALQERTRLARELHDSVSQALYGIGLGARTARTLLERDPVKAAEPLDYVLSLVEAGLTEMRALIFQLRPETLENEGLVAALSKQAAAMQARHGIHVLAELGDEPQVSLALKQTLYLLAREAMHNTVKHAHASNVVIRLHNSGGDWVLEIEDDGAGFDVDVQLDGHLGLRSMRERVAQARGSIVIDSAPGAGTRIRVQIPSQG